MSFSLSEDSGVQEKLEIVLDDSEEKEIQHNIDDDSLKDGSKAVLHNAEPVITTGHDVSRFVVDIRDDEDSALTFRSIFLGTIFAGMGAALSQVRDFKFLHDGSLVQTVILIVSGRYTYSSQCRCQSPPSS